MDNFVVGYARPKVHQNIQTIAKAIEREPNTGRKQLYLSAFNSLGQGIRLFDDRTEAETHRLGLEELYSGLESEMEVFLYAF